MEETLDTTLDGTSRPVWQNMVESPLIENVPASIPSCKYKLKLKCGGFFRQTKNSCKKIYCFGFQKCIYIDTWSYNLSQLNEEIVRRYSSKNNPVFLISYVDKYADDQSFIQLDSDEKFMGMLIMYEDEKQVTIYVTTQNNLGSDNSCFRNRLCDVNDEQHDDSDYCPSDESYHSHLSSDNEDAAMDDDDDDEGYSFTNHSLSMKVGTKFGNAVDFKTALNHYAIIHEFDYFIQKSDKTRFNARCKNLDCEWRIYASIMQDGITFEVRKIEDGHTCTRSNKAGNNRATKKWVANIVTDKLKSDGDVSPVELQKWIMRTYNVNVPYLKVFRGKEQAYTDMHGKWEDSFMNMDVFREELLNRNPGSVVEIDFDVVGDKKLFKSNNSIFPIAYCVLESENTHSWTWFRESLKKAIGTPNGLVISSDMQKGLEVAIMQVYPNVEHRESKTYSPSRHDRLLKDINEQNKEAITYLNTHHKKIWSRSKFGTTSKCTYFTNNISESFNSWIGKLCYKPVLGLLDGIREKLMKRFDKKRKLVKKWNGALVPNAKNHVNEISMNLGEYEVSQSCDNQAEVKFKGTRWEVNLDERCSCRVWQVRGLPCVHVAAFIAFTRTVNWDEYVDSCYTIEKYKAAYAFQVAPMPGEDQWMQKDGGKIYPPKIKRPP